MSGFLYTVHVLYNPAITVCMLRRLSIRVEIADQISNFVNGQCVD